MYWERDQEITLLHIVLEACDSQCGTGTADSIICGLIEMELVDCDRAPNAQDAWENAWDGTDVTRDLIEQWYCTDDERCGHPGCYVRATRELYPPLDDEDGTTLCCADDTHSPFDLALCDVEMVSP